MFDLRYHVASLTAVFVALILGILLGVGISGRGLVDEAEREELNIVIRELRAQRDAAVARIDALSEEERGANAFVDVSYPLIMEDRLRGKRVAIVAVGTLGETHEAAVRRTVGDAGGRVARTIVLRMPVEPEPLLEAYNGRPGQRAATAEAVAPRIGQELVAGWKAVLTAVAPVIVEEQEGDLTTPVDGVVVIRDAPQMGESGRFVKALYAALLRAGVPAVGVEIGGADPSAAPRFAAAGLSTVEPVDSAAGRLALAALLAGSPVGSYGTAEGAQAVLPPIEPVAGG